MTWAWCMLTVEPKNSGGSICFFCLFEVAPNYIFGKYIMHVYLAPLTKLNCNDVACIAESLKAY